MPDSVVPGEPFVHAVRFAAVPRELKALLARLGPWAVDVWMPDEPGLLSASQRQLLKLSLPGGPLRLVRVRSGEHAEPALLVTREGRTASFSRADLERDVRDLVRQMVAELCQPIELACQGEAFAMDVVRHETVRQLTARMLQAADLEHALYIMLLGITSGYGAGFHRAALYIFDESTGGFRGRSAVGPSSEEEAHRIWEAIEYEDKTLEQAIDDYPSGVDTLFQSFVRTCDLVAGDDERDEIRAALASPRPLVFRSEPRHNAGLARLVEPATEFVIAAIRPREETLGLIVADNAYGLRPLLPEQTALFEAFVGPLSLVWETRTLLRRVESLARYDALTGVFNRRELDARFAEEQSRCVRSRRPISIALVDLDLFKAVNDTRGHEAGDAALRNVGALLRQSLRPHDVACRYGGDEFVLMLAECNKIELLAAVTRIGRLAKEEGISLSIGGATWPDDCAEPASLLAVADANLYSAKAAGRCRAVAGGSETVTF
jgi:diguanylate cyclase (GGDEF)-like protein